jgi:small subunit ribosomal protein S9
MATEKEPVKKETKRAVPAAAHRPAAHRAPAAHPAARVAQHPATHAAHAASAAHAVSTAPKGRYTEGIGRRKTAVARVRITAGNGKMTINGKEAKNYFVLPRLLMAAFAPIKELQLVDIDVTAHVGGGGINAQAEAVRHGLTRAIIIKTPEWKPRLRAMGYVTRDSRMVERKKYGLRKARRAPQWAKR